MRFDSMDSIPVVDLSEISSKDYDDKNPAWERAGREIGDAFHKIGFVYIVNHQLDAKKIEAAFTTSKDFFEQRLEKKLKYKLENATKGYHGGYSVQGSRSSSVSDKGNQDMVFELRESYDFAGKVGQKVKESTDFHSSLSSLQEECTTVVKILFKLIGIGLDLDDTNFFIKQSEWIDDSAVPSFKTFRSLYYPAIPENISIPSGKARVKEHSDFGFITLLFQDSIGGLEVKTAEGKWIPAPPIPGTILVNIGDMLEHWTGGYYPATKHRVLIPESEIKKRTPRQSIVYFLHPDSTATMEPLISKRLGNYHFEKTKAYEYAKNKLAGVSSY